MLHVQARHRLGDFALDAALTAPAGSVTVLVGESGSGKTTLLRLICGLLEPESGRIALGEEIWVDRSTHAFLPPELRPIGYVSQEYALFPHMSVADNVAFGLRALGVPRREVMHRVGQALERFGLAAFAPRRPGALSGGQQQRVALARALVLDPAVLLLDEPLSALDLASRRAVRTELRRILEGLSCVTIFVTHEPVEALTFGETIAVLEGGRVTQRGTRGEFLRQPRSRYVAEFLGVNWLEGRVAERHADGLASVACDGGVVAVPDPGMDGDVRLLVHPHDVVLSPEPPAGSARNVFGGRVEEIIPEPPRGERVRVLVASRPALTAQVTQDAVERLGLRRGAEVFASFKATGVEVLPA